MPKHNNSVKINLENFENELKMLKAEQAKIINNVIKVVAKNKQEQALNDIRNQIKK
ncbi:MAG: hypothetical protein WCK11_04770 [Candidatus Falkowbacteria bacterium]